MANRGFNLEDLLKGFGQSGQGQAGDPEQPRWSPSKEMQTESAKKLLRRLQVVFFVAIIPIILIAYWWFHPPISIHSTDTWMFVTIFILLPIFLWLRYRSSLHTQGNSKTRQAKQTTDATADDSGTAAAKSKKLGATNPARAKLFKRLSYIPVAVVALGIVGGLLSSEIFPGNAERYATVLKSQTSDFSADISEVNYTEIPVIDRDSAAILGTREMGAIPDYVSQFEISDLYSQINYQGKPVRVSPLNYADLIKWFNNRQNGLPGFVLVDMSTQDAEIVRLEQPVHYSQSEPLFRNVDRHVQLNYPFYMFDEISFEIDDDGRPYWVCPVQKRSIGLFGGTTIHRVVLCDAVTGECTDLAVEECPTWVDRVYPAELLIQQYNWYGAYANGWINSWWGQEGVVQTTPGTDGQLGYNYIAKDDDVWVYTGVTSATADNSIVGFVLINQRTAESHYYQISGATEETAMRSAEGQVQDLGYQATFPLLLNINSQPTYFMALKDSAGFVKQYAMIDIQRSQNVAIGDTLPQCQESYLSLLRTNGVEMPEPEAPTFEKAMGTVKRVVTAVVDGNSHFYITLDGDNNIYDCAIPQTMEVLLVEEGFEVEIEYNDVEGVRVAYSLKITNDEPASGTTTSAVPVTVPAVPTT